MSKVEDGKTPIPEGNGLWTQQEFQQLLQLLRFFDEETWLSKLKWEAQSMVGPA